MAKHDPDTASSRAYYAAFYAVSAYFAISGTIFHRHTAVQAAVHRDLVNTGKWPDELGEDFRSLIDLRQTGDYGMYESVSESDALLAVTAAERIIAAVAPSFP